MIISNKKEYKVVIIGEGRVGKTSIMIRFVEDKFNIKQQTTVNASYLQKTVTIEGSSATLNIWVHLLSGYRRARSVPRAQPPVLQGRTIRYHCV
jgi:GTPase SAR1 family protein